MSLEQLERQIQLASLALEKANKSGDKLKKAKVRDELIKFTKVLERSKARLQELEMVKKQCDDLSAVRDSKKDHVTAETKSTLSAKKSVMARDRSHLEPIVIPWLQKQPDKEVQETVEVTLEAKPENKSEQRPTDKPEKNEEMPTDKREENEEKRDAVQAEERKDDQAEERNEVEERNDVETSSMIDLAMSFGNQIVTSASGFASDVSSLGSQVFGSSEITTAVCKEKEVNFKTSLQGISKHRSGGFFTSPANKSRSEGFFSTPISLLDPLRRFSTLSETKPEPEEQETQEEPMKPMEIEDPLEIVHSFTTATKNDEGLSPEYIAEQELKAREKYIKLSKEHQELRRSGLPQDSRPMKQSEKALRDCYAEIEYWESYGEEASKNGSTSRDKIKTFLGRNPTKSPHLDVDEETTKARDAYAYAMMCHQALVAQRVCTTSKEWNDSQAKVNETLATLQYWEGRSAFAVPPSI